MARTGVTFEEVSDLATKILVQGQAPTVARIREHLGTGSSTTINNHLNAWRQAQQNKTWLKLPQALPESLVPLLETLWLKAIDEANGQFNDDRADWKSAIDAQQIKNSELVKRLNEAEQTITLQQNELEHQQQSIDDLLTTHTKYQAEIEQQQKASNDAKERLTAEIEELTAKLDKERDTYQSMIKDTEQKFIQEQTRNEQAEATWMNLFDQSKLELDSAKKELNSHRGLQNELNQLKTQKISFEEQISQLKIQFQESRTELEKERSESKALDHTCTKYKLLNQSLKLELSELNLKFESVTKQYESGLRQNKDLETKLIKANASLESNDQLLNLLNTDKISN